MYTHIKVSFLGGLASGDNLTGSCILLTVEQGKSISNIIVDIGLIQCSFKESLIKNQRILSQLNIKSIDSIILTHSHTDHVGRLPLLVKNGFCGRVICTKSSAKILPIMLDDTAKIQAIEAHYIRDRDLKDQNNLISNRSKSRDALCLGKYDQRRNKKNIVEEISCEPLYDSRDVALTMTMVKNDGFDYYEWIKISKNILLKFYPSGHVLGGAIVVLKIKDVKRDIYLGFSGDLGRPDGIILPPPQIVNEELDYWFIESTYGGKVHPTRNQEIFQIQEIIREAANKNQKILIPSFALERAQEIIYLLSFYMSIGEIPSIPIYLDSPLASRITDIFEDNWNLGMFLDQNRLKFNPFSIYENKYLKLISKDEDSNSLSLKSGPYIVIAGSGMCDAGRIRSHLYNNLSRNDAIICLVGYMAVNSLGRKLQEGLPIVRMNKKDIMVKARIIKFESFSAHADSNYLTEYTKNVATKCKKIFIIHGEEASAVALKLQLMNNLTGNKTSENWLKDIIIPKFEKIVLL